MGSSRRRSSLAALGTVALLTTGCIVLDGTPGMRTCSSGVGRYLGFGPSSGVMRVLPSGVAGVEIDSTGWRTDAHLDGFGTSTVLALAVRIHAERPITSDSLALIYRTNADEGSARATIIDPRLGPAVYSRAPAELEAISRAEFDPVRPIAAGSDLRSEYSMNVGGGGFLSGPTVWSAACPVSVQLVPHRDLALYLFPGRFSPATVARLADSVRLADATQADANAVVIWDSTVAWGFGFTTVIGVVANRGDTPVSDPVAWLSVEHDPASRAQALPGSATDTLEYPLGPIAPHEIAGFAGGQLQFSQRVSGRRVGSAMLVSDRPFATSADFQSVRRARRRARTP